MSDESLEGVEAVDSQENKTVDVEAEEVPLEPSKTDEDVKEDAAQEVEETSKEETQSEPTEADKVRNAMQKRIDRQTAALRETQNEMLELRKQIEEAAPKRESLEPKEDDFETFEEYQDALIEHKTSERVAAKEAELKQRQLMEKQQLAFEQGKKQFAERELEFEKSNPDYREKATAFQELAQDVVRSKGADNPTVRAIGQVLTEADLAPALIHELASNEEALYELAELSPVGAAFKLFEMQTSINTSQTPAEVDKKPTPVKPLKGSGRPTKPLEQRSSKDILAWVNS